jgi:hypothetical protein
MAATLSLLPRDIRFLGQSDEEIYQFGDIQQADGTAGRSRFALRHGVSGFARCRDAHDPLHVMAHDQGWVYRQDRSTGPDVQAVRLGSCGRIGSAVYRDTLILAPKELE